MHTPRRTPVLRPAVGLLLLLLAASACAQEEIPAPPPPAADTDPAAEAGLPLEEDVATLDGIIKAYYEVVSGPAGEPRQTARDRSLHHPDARAIITGTDSTGTPFIRNMTLAEYHRISESGNNPAFYEAEIHRVTQRFGNVAHVWSTYAWRRAEDGPVQGRGINSIQLYHDGARWWITAWIFDSERPDNPIPADYLPGESE